VELLDGIEKLLGSANWNELAELDPLWTILSEPEKKFGKWDPAAFFKTGEREAERVLTMCENHNINISFEKLLDFGCGVGRMTRAFSGFFRSCVGIDVSEKMVRLAREFNSGQPRCEFILNDAPVLPFEDKSFDFIFTVLVLQHLPTKDLISRYLADFIRVAKDNGVIVFQLPNEVPLRRRIQLRRRLWRVLALVGVPKSWLFKKLRLAPIHMNGMSRQEVERVICGCGARVRAVERYDLSEGRYHSYYYFVSKECGSSS
jgi:SAM-dependent methyltransferase